MDVLKVITYFLTYVHIVRQAYNFIKDYFDPPTLLKIKITKSKEN